MWWWTLSSAWALPWSPGTTLEAVATTQVESTDAAAATASANGVIRTRMKLTAGAPGERIVTLKSNVVDLTGSERLRERFHRDASMLLALDAVVISADGEFLRLLDEQASTSAYAKILPAGVTAPEAQAVEAAARQLWEGWGGMASKTRTLSSAKDVPAQMAMMVRGGTVPARMQTTVVLDAPCPMPAQGRCDRVEVEVRADGPKTAVLLSEQIPQATVTHVDKGSRSVVWSRDGFPIRSETTTRTGIGLKAGGREGNAVEEQTTNVVFSVVHGSR